uniref:Splicing factor YJU2 n=1 Tax=Sus scrofa TaxID=9823 RepID=A0A8D1MWZ9_PIG
MSERKVLNKYYPPDFDPSKIPKLKLPKDRQYVVRLMAPFNMRCKTCGEYIYKGKKFNARKETVQNEAYLGLPIFRFYIKCTRCLAEITFKTDPENTDYTMEHGATRNFQAEKLLEEEEKRVQKEREDEELNNPMKVLENRTKDSKLEMEVLENLQELKDLNQRQAHVDFEAMLRQHRLSEEERQKREQEEDERETAALVEESRKRRLLEDSDSEEDAAPTQPWPALPPNPTAILDEATPSVYGDSQARGQIGATAASLHHSSRQRQILNPLSEGRDQTHNLMFSRSIHFCCSTMAPKAKRKVESWERSVGTLGSRPQLSRLVVVKKTDLDRSIQRGLAPPSAVMNGKTAEPSPQAPGPSSLSQLGVYSDSEDSSGSN